MSSTRVAQLTMEAKELKQEAHNKRVKADSLKAKVERLQAALAGKEGDDLNAARSEIAATEKEAVHLKKAAKEASWEASAKTLAAEELAAVQLRAESRSRSPVRLFERSPSPRVTGGTATPGSHEDTQLKCLAAMTKVADELRKGNKRRRRSRSSSSSASEKGDADVTSAIELLSKYSLGDIDVVNLPKPKVISQAMKDAAAAKKKGRFPFVSDDLGPKFASVREADAEWLKHTDKMSMGQFSSLWWRRALLQLIVQAHTQKQTLTFGEIMNRWLVLVQLSCEEGVATAAKYDRETWREAAAKFRANDMSFSSSALSHLVENKLSAVMRSKNQNDVPRGRPPLSKGDGKGRDKAVENLFVKKESGGSSGDRRDLVLKERPFGHFVSQDDKRHHSGHDSTGRFVSQEDKRHQSGHDSRYGRDNGRGQSGGGRHFGQDDKRHRHGNSFGSSSSGQAYGKSDARR